MRTSFLLGITLPILILSSEATAQWGSQIKCPSLQSNEHVSRIQCLQHDGSVIDVEGLGPFNCKLSYFAIRPPTIKASTYQQEKPHTKDEAQCELWLIQFTDHGLVQRSCCWEELSNRDSGTQEHEDPDLDSQQQPLRSGEGIEEHIQYLKTEDGVTDRKDQTEDVKGYAFEDEYEDESEEWDGEEEYNYEDEDEEYEDVADEEVEEEVEEEDDYSSDEHNGDGEEESQLGPEGRRITSKERDSPENQETEL
ncbi:hypothetical protein DER44DRAFT_770363 [Fusarium oxysporum]|nr:hypothetical protein DER44DRAFT_770363 [Fusarium oxysporum]